MVIEVRGVNKSYLKGGRRTQYSFIDIFKRRFNQKGYFHALNDVSFDVREGEVFSLLGRNGAGKTTMIKILSGLLLKDSGSARVYGYDVDKDMEEIKRLLGAVIVRIKNSSSSVEKDLLNYALLYGINGNQAKERVEELIDVFDLESVRRNSTVTLSTGYNQRLKLAKSIIHKPKVLLLDEPTIGLDPKIQLELWSKILKLKKEYGMTILLTTHYMQEVERYADRVAFLKQGVLSNVDTVSNFKNSLRKKGFRIRIDSSKNDFLKSMLKDEGYDVLRLNGKLFVEVRDYSHIVRVLRNVQASNVLLHSFEVLEPSMEDVFINYLK